MFLFYRWYLGLKRGDAFLCVMGTIMGLIGLVTYEKHEADQMGGDVAGWRLICQGIWVIAGLPLVIKLYRTWLGGHITEREKAPGAEGFRAWLSPANILLAILAAVGAEAGFGYSGFGVFALIIMALLAYPALMAANQSTRSRVAPDLAENLTAEREKVLSLLEAGKITAEESAELLNALGSTLKAEPSRTQLLPAQRIMLIGAAVVLIGFFMPWFTINLGDEMQRLGGQLQQQMNQFQQQMPGMPAMTGQGMPDMSKFLNAPAGTVKVAGGDIPHGLGWIILVLSLGAALLPLMAHHLDAETQRTVTLVGLGTGTLMLVYLLSDSLRWVSLGMVLAAAGYFVQWVAILRRGARAVPAASGIGQHA